MYFIFGLIHACTVYLLHVSLNFIIPDVYIFYLTNLGKLPFYLKLDVWTNGRTNRNWLPSTITYVYSLYRPKNCAKGHKKVRHLKKQWCYLQNTLTYFAVLETDFLNKGNIFFQFIFGKLITNKVQLTFTTKTLDLEWLTDLIIIWKTAQEMRTSSMEYIIY